MTQDFAIDPKLLLTLDDLSLVARTVVEGFLGGLHRSPFLGCSTEFASYRQYIQGDNLRHVDWKVWGRTDELYVKQFEDDTNLPCHILFDTSASMDFGAGNKFQYGKMLAAALAYLMVRQHDAPGLALFNDTASHALPARSSRRHLEEMLLTLAAAKAGGRTAIGDDLSGVVQTFTRRGVVVVISDLFASGQRAADLLRQLHFQGQEVIVFHLLSAEELDFEFEGEYIIQDSETGEELPVHAPGFRAEYKKRIGDFCRQMEDECASLEMDYQRIRTDQPLDAALGAYLTKRLEV